MVTQEYFYFSWKKTKSEKKTKWLGIEAQLTVKFYEKSFKWRGVEKEKPSES